MKRNLQCIPFDYLFSGGTSVVSIGLNDKDTEGKFTWTDKTPYSFNKWTQPNEPNGNRTENCVEMRQDGTWNDFACKRTRPYVCKKDLN